jgi:DNA-binding NarL/FixJ family response regulator
VTYKSSNRKSARKPEPAEIADRELDSAKEALREVKEKLPAIIDNIDETTSSFFRRLSTKYADPAATEVEVANPVKHVRTIKEIADMLNVSAETVEVHRMNLRKKMGIAKTKTSLRTHLPSLG